MKKSAIALAVFVAALFAVSCQKENGPASDSGAAELTPMTFNAVSEGIGVVSKVEMAYKYDLLWQENDEILVKDASNSATFKLNGGAGTTKGTFFCEASPFQAGDAVEAFYPESIVSGSDLVWPATFTADKTVPMYSKKTLSAAENQTFSFASLGSVLQLIFSTTSKDAVLKSIEVKADQAMSGKFTINEKGEAVISQPDGADKPGVTLDLGDAGVAIGVTAKKFNIAIPAGTYTNLTITFIAKDGQKCIKHATKAQSIEYNAVHTLALSMIPVESVSLDKSAALVIGSTVILTATVLPENASNKTVGWSSDKPDVATVDATGKVTAVASGTAIITATTTDGSKTANCTVTVLPAGALLGGFSVSDTEKVYFSKGNLQATYDSSEGDYSWSFAAKQYDYIGKASGNLNPTQDDGVIDLFCWSTDASNNKWGTHTKTAATTGYTTGSFKDWGKAYCLSNNIAEGTWYTLTNNELQYLFACNSSGNENMDTSSPRYNLYKCFVTVCGKKNCLVIAPDDWDLSANPLQSSYGTEPSEGNPMTWEQAEAKGLVCLPAAGWRRGTTFYNNDVRGNYWSQTESGTTEAYYLGWASDQGKFDVGERGSSRYFGYSVRLVTKCQ